MIIDIRCRLTTGPSAEYFCKKMGRKAAPALIEGTEAAFFRDLDDAGITVAVGPSGNNLGMTLGHRELPPRTTSNDDQADIQTRYPGRYIGVAGIDVSDTIHNSLEELERCTGILGLKVATIEPGRAPLHAPNPADKRIYPFYSLAQELGIPVIIQTSGMLGGKNIDYANPRWIDQVAEDFPGLTIICGHGCYPFVREMIVVTKRRENVYASPDLYLFGLGRTDWLQSINRGSLVAKKFIFGSGYPYGSNLRNFVNNFMLLPWKPGVLDRILYRNALRALKLDNDPGFSGMYSQHDFYTRTSFTLRKLSALRDKAFAKLKIP